MVLPTVPIVTPARFGVDPAELLAAAAAAGEIADQMRAARSAVLAADGSGRWAPDPRLASVAGRAADALLAACDVAIARAALLEDALRVASRAYARSDRQWAR